MRDLYTGYMGAATGSQARTALETNGTQAFVDTLRTKGTACAENAASGLAADPSCDQDPIVCAPAKPTLTTVVVQSAGNGTATATAVVTPEGKGRMNR